MDFEQLYHDKCCEKLKLQTENNQLQSRIAELEQFKQEALEMAEFYGDKFNWRTNSGKVGITALTNGQDHEIIDEHWTGGKKARQFLAKWKGLL